MPINTVQCTKCGNRIHYSVDDFNTEKNIDCNRCGNINHVDVNSISESVAEEIRFLKEERERENVLRETTFKPSFEGENGMPKSNWQPRHTTLSEENAELDEKLDSVKQKFKQARAELNDVGTVFTPSSPEELIDRFTADNVDLSVNIPVADDEMDDSSFLKQKALKLAAKLYFDGDVRQANKIYDFLKTLLNACKNQNLDFRSVAMNEETVLDFAQQCGISQDIFLLLEELYRSGKIAELVGLLDKHLR